jgi:U3 small nucleolar RNA-associated protein 14
MKHFLTVMIMRNSEFNKRWLKYLVNEGPTKPVEAGAKYGSTVASCLDQALLTLYLEEHAGFDPENSRDKEEQFLPNVIIASAKQLNSQCRFNEGDFDDYRWKVGKFVSYLCGSGGPDWKAQTAAKILTAVEHNDESLNPCYQ